MLLVARPVCGEEVVRRELGGRMVVEGGGGRVVVGSSLGLVVAWSRTAWWRKRGWRIGGRAPHAHAGARGARQLLRGVGGLCSVLILIE